MLVLEAGSIWEEGLKKKDAFVIVLWKSVIVIVDGN